jgi:hypothetical protein
LGFAALVGAGIGSSASAQEQTPASSPLGTGERIATSGDPKDGSGPAMAAAVGDYPKISFDTLASVELTGMSASSGPGRGPTLYPRFDSTLLVDFNDQLSFDALFQFKARQPRPATDPNKDLFINQGAGRRVGGKFKELYVRYGTWRIGKFVQDFGRAYYLLPGPFSADFIEESDQGYEPSDMIGVEKIHVFGNEQHGWQQLSVAAFFFDRTFLHESFPYNEGMVHYRDGGVGNTRLPTNIMVTYDVLNMPIGHGAQLSGQASVVRYGKSFGAQRGEFWSTLGADIAIPLRGSVADTLAGRYSQLRFYAEAARRANFNGVVGRARNFASLSGEYLTGRWLFDLTATRRWTTDRVVPTQYDHLYTATLSHSTPHIGLVALSFAHENVGARRGIYAGVRITQAFNVCSRCLTRGTAY